MRAVAAIALNTFREAVRDRVLYLFVGFAVLLLVSSKLFGMMTVGDEGKVIKDLGLAGIQFFSPARRMLTSPVILTILPVKFTAYSSASRPYS